MHGLGAVLCFAMRALGCDADDTAKSLQEDDKYIDLHMNVVEGDGHTIGGPSPPPWCVDCLTCYMQIYVFVIFL